MTGEDERAERDFSADAECDLESATDPLRGAAPEPEGGLEASAVRSTAILVVRVVALQGLALGATLVLARLLSPSEYGAFAVASVVQQASRAVIELGLSAPLIQRADPPTPSEQRAVTGVTLAAGLAICVVAALLAFVVLPAAGVKSEVMRLIAIACVSLPLLALQIVPASLLERNMRFGRFAIIEALAAVAFYGYALAAAATGSGAYSLTVAVPVAAVVSLIAFIPLQPWARGVSLDLGSIRPIAGFGIQAGGAHMLGLLREAGLVAGLAALGGRSLAGFYDMSRRLMALPIALMLSTYRVAFPALSRAREEQRPQQVIRGVGLLALAAGLPLALVVGTAEQLVSILFGERWAPAGDIVVISAPAILLFTSVGVLLSRLALAGGDARTPLLAELAQGIVTLGCLATVPSLGTTGAGIAIAGGYVASVAILMTRTPDSLKCAAPALRGLAIAGMAAGVGALIDPAAEPGPLAATLLAVAAVWLAVSWLAARDQLRGLLAMAAHLRPA